MKHLTRPVGALARRMIPLIKVMAVASIAVLVGSGCRAPREVVQTEPATEKAQVTVSMLPRLILPERSARGEGIHFPTMPFELQRYDEFYRTNAWLKFGFVVCSEGPIEPFPWDEETSPWRIRNDTVEHIEPGAIASRDLPLTRRSIGGATVSGWVITGADGERGSGQRRW